MQSSGQDDGLSPSRFAMVLAEVFGDEPWADVEPYAARAWSQLPTPHQWEDVRAAVSTWFAQRSDRQ
jgi:hypothetical protein